jgi:hypothetical protein
MSGYTDVVAKLVGLKDQIALLPKPFTPKVLRQKVAAILTGKPPDPAGLS